MSRAPSSSANDGRSALIDRAIARLSRVFGVRRLYAQMLVVAAIVIAGLSLVYAIYVDRRLAETERVEKVRQAGALASSVATAAMQALVTRDYAMLEQSLLAFGRFPHVLEIAVTDEKGIVLSAVRAEPGGEPVPLPGMAPRQPPRTRADREGVTDEAIAASATIEASSVIGWVHVRFDRQGEAEARRDWRLDSAFFLLLMLALTLASLSFLFARATRPLVLVKRFARELPSNVGSMLAIDASSEEIDEVVRALNHASLQLERHHAELARGRALTEGILRASMDAILTFDVTGRIGTANRATRTLLGYDFADAGSALPRMWELFADPQAGRLLREEAEAGDGVSFINQRVEHRLMHRDGTIVFAELEVARIEDSQPPMYAAILRDVEERRVYEQAIVEQNERLNTILELCPDGFVLVNAEGRVGYANPAFCRMTGLHRQEVELQPFEDFAFTFGELCDDESGGAGFSRVDDLLATTSRLSVLSQPEHRVVQIAARRSDASTVLCLRDVTRETEVDRMKSQFLSSAAHELRTPMVSVLGFAELLLNRRYNEERQKVMIGTIHRQSKLLVGLINELLDLARIEARRGADFKLAPRDLRDIARESAEAFLMPGDARRVDMHLADEPMMVVADRDKIRQALTNLISNAYKYSPEGGAIELHVQRKSQAGADFIGLVVRDHGIGMTPEQLSHAFERFFRADASGNIPGTGLGLSLVKEIVQLHRGHVTLQSVFGQGTEAALWLPAAPVAETA